MPPSRVAENSIRWPARGVASSSRRTAGRKPRSAMWSASSSTVISTASSETWPWPMRSSSRPGQATTTSTPRRSAETCGPWPTPPKTVREVRPRRCASGVIASSIWATSSRVGARISARGRRGCGAAAARREPGEQGQHEGVGLAGAGAAAAEHVATRERVGQRRGLDGGGGRDAARGEHLDEGGGHAERAEVLGGQGRFLHGSWGRRDRRGRRRLGCSAGRGSGPRRRVAGTEVPTRRHRHQRSRGPRQKAGHSDQSTGHRCHPSNRAGAVGPTRRSSPRAGPSAPPPTVTYAVAAALPARHRPAPRRPPAAVLFEPRYLVLARTLAERTTTTGGSGCTLIRKGHEVGPDAVQDLAASAARRRVDAMALVDGPSARRCTSSPPGCDGSASTGSTNGRHPVHHRRRHLAARPAGRRRPGGHGARRAGACARTRPTSSVSGRRWSRSRRPCRASPIESPSGWCSTRPTASGCSRGPMRATRLRTVLALLRREAAIVGRFGAVPTPAHPGGASLN